MFIKKFNVWNDYIPATPHFAALSPCVRLYEFNKSTTLFLYICLFPYMNIYSSVENMSKYRYDTLSTNGHTHTHTHIYIYVSVFILSFNYYSIMP